MKKLTNSFLIALSGALLFLSSCDKAKVDIDFDLSMANIHLFIDTTSSVGAMSFASTNFTSDLEAKLNSHNASLNDIQSITLTGATFTMINPGGQNFDIVDQAYAFLSAPGLVETRIAYKDPVPNGVQQISLDADQADLKEYLKQPIVGFRSSGVTNAPNVQSDSVLVDLTFKVRASVKP
jgi:hypothetical protein